MSTRCRIGIVQKDGTIKSIYCHYDGYPEGVGATLQKYYNTRKKVEKLMKLGDISSLGKEYDQELSKLNWKRYDDNLSDKDKELLKKLDDGDYTVTYKDRGETGIDGRVDDNEEAFICNSIGSWEDYTYLFKPSYDGVEKWHFMPLPYFRSLETFKEEQ